MITSILKKNDSQANAYNFQKLKNEEASSLFTSPPKRNITSVMLSQADTSIPNSQKVTDTRKKSLLLEINSRIEEIRELQTYLSEDKLMKLDSNFNKLQTGNTKSIDYKRNKSSNHSNANLLPDTLIICDDSSLIRQSLKLILIQIPEVVLKYNIIECRDGIEILMKMIDDQVEGNRIKAILTDENMEYMNGSESIKILKRLESNNKIKKCYYFSITAFEDEATKNNIKSAGIEEILSKPPSKSLVLSLLKRYELI